MEAVLIFIIGACIGSFLNVLADRLPRGESVLWGRSHCDYCKKPLRWFELIPVLSFLIQRGRCLRCHKPLSIQYPLVELVTACGFVFLYPNIPYLIIFSVLLVLFIADFKYQILPDSMIVIGILVTSVMLVVSPTASHQILEHIYSAAGGFAFLYLLWAVTRGRGMGFGDVKLAIFMGLFLGYPDIIIAFYIAFLTGAAAGVILILSGKKGWKSKIAFGPFLILGTGSAFIWGQNILQVLHSWNFWL